MAKLGPVRLRFYSGTLEVRPDDDAFDIEAAGLNSLVKRDKRSGCYRAPAYQYASIVRALLRAEADLVDDARIYPEIAGPVKTREPRPYQSAAVEAWVKARGRGTVVLPTGAGKTQVALMAIAEKKRATLVVAPTLDLVRQWHEELETMFGVEVGVIGGGDYSPQAITVTTYDSAYLHMENLGARFGLIVFDEVHHLPAPAYASAAQMALAPFRLGLSATPEREDGAERLLTDIVGPIVYREEIRAMAGEYLAAYTTEKVAVEMSEDARKEYEESRALYRQFLSDNNIYIGSPRGWATFIQRSAGSDEGRAAFLAYRRQKELAQAAPEKIDVVGDLLRKHSGERMIVFTHDNATAYAISRALLLPIITHQTKVAERTEILKAFRAGTFDCVVTSRVLNEGVDVPEAGVAIVVSGTGSVREHVQRLGRILRKREGKQAVLYEIVTANSAEGQTSRRRRNHAAYGATAEEAPESDVESGAERDEVDEEGAGNAHQ